MTSTDTLAQTQTSSDPHPYSTRSRQYALDVTEGREVSGRLEKLSCERFLRDLQRQKDPRFRFKYDVALAERVCTFAESLVHVKGPLAGQNFYIEPFEAFFLCNVFGWVDAKTRLRRFRRFYMEVARGNGKSFLLSVVALYMLGLDGESGAEIYSAATTRDQAKIVFLVAKEMVRRCPEMTSEFGITRHANAITHAESGSSFTALTAEDSTLDGLNVHFAAVDELHAHRTRGVYDVLETAISKRDQPILGVITTAGADRNGVCYEVRTDLVKILQGEYQDDSFFGVIYTMDEGDEWRDESIWRKANPNLGVSVNTESLRDLARKAERTPAAQNSFKTKHLNIWVGANAALFDTEAWMKAADPTLKIEDFEGQPCIMGLDLATKDDIASRCTVFWDNDEDTGAPRLTVFWKNYIPEIALSDGRNDRYEGWAVQDAVVPTPGNTIDFRKIEQDILDDCRKYDVNPVALDPWQATQMGQRLMENGIEVAEVRAIVSNFTEPTKTLGALILEGRIRHNGDPCAAWSLANVVGHYDLKGNVFPQKERAENKIDPIIALVIALSVWIRKVDPWAYSRTFDEGVMFL